MGSKPRANIRSAFAIWAVGIALGIGAGAIAASVLRYVAPEAAPVASLASPAR